MINLFIDFLADIVEKMGKGKLFKITIFRKRFKWSGFKKRK